MPANFACKEPPDPEWAEYNLSRLKEAHPTFAWQDLSEESLFRLKILLGFSPYATNILLRRKEVLTLFLREPFPRPRGPQALWRLFLKEGARLEDWREFARWLRHLKQEEVIKILSQDLAGERLSRTTYALTRLADFFLKAGLFWLTEKVFTPELRPRFLVFALGKHGGRELNYSSDIDLVYFYQGHLREKETFTALARELTRLLDTIIEGERLFRVDLRLRPGGKDGELVYTLKAGLSYYFYHSHPFERLALLRARPVTGDLRLGRAFLRALRPVIYPRFLDYSFLEHLKDLKERISREAARKGAERDLKLGPGGIREIEFFVQAFQVVYGGKDPGLRVRNSLWALRKLARKRIIPEEEAAFLKEAYLLLRNTEHRLQTVHFRQTYLLPTEEAALMRLSRSLGYPGAEAFLAELERTREGVNRIFRRLFAPKRTGGGLKEEIEAFFEGKRPAKELSELLGVSAHLLEDARRLARPLGPLGAKRGPILKEILSFALERASRLKEKDKALARFLSFLEKLGGRISFFHALRYHPEKIDDLLAVFEKSQFLSHLLNEAPAAAEALFRQEALPPLEQRLKGKETEEALSLLRLTRNEELFRLGYLDLKEGLSPEALSAELSRLAEEILSHTFALVLREAGLRGGLSVFGMGSLGARELGYRSDLDLVFVSERGEDLVPHTKAAQLFLHYLTTPLPEGPGWPVDTRLRPEGRKGPLVVSLSGFLTYYREEAALWEKLALVRLRPVTGDQALAARVVKEIISLLTASSFGEEEAARVWEMRLKMEKERVTPGLINLKVGPGGLSDLEFALAFLELKNLKKLKRLEGNVLEALALLTERGLLPEEEATRLKENYLFLRRLEQLLVLLLDKAGEEREYRAEEILLTEEFLGQGVMDRLKEAQEENRHFLKKALGVS